MQSHQLNIPSPLNAPTPTKPTRHHLGPISRKSRPQIRPNLTCANLNFITTSQCTFSYDLLSMRRCSLMQTPCRCITTRCKNTPEKAQKPEQTPLGSFQSNRSSIDPAAPGRFLTTKKSISKLISACFCRFSVRINTRIMAIMVTVLIDAPNSAKNSSCLG